MCFISFQCGKRKTLRACLGLDGLVFIPGSPSPMTTSLVDLFFSSYSPLKFLLVDSFSLPPQSFIPWSSCSLLSEGSVMYTSIRVDYLSLPILLYLILSGSHGLEELRHLWLWDRTNELCDRLTVLKGYDGRKRSDLDREIEEIMTHVKN